MINQDVLRRFEHPTVNGLHNLSSLASAATKRRKVNNVPVDRPDVTRSSHDIWERHGRAEDDAPFPIQLGRELERAPPGFDG